MKYYFIINPNSGKIDTNQFEQRILKECSKEKIKYKIFYTHNAGDAKKFAKKIPDEECVVFSVGGDGNLNAVLNGLAGSKNKILGNIPTGSGNDFERTLSQYDDGIHDFDFGIINGRHFVNVACVGLDADVANNISWIRKKKWIPVSQRYNASILYTFIKYKFKKVKVQMTIIKVLKTNAQYLPYAMVNIMVEVLEWHPTLHLTMDYLMYILWKKCQRLRFYHCL